MSPRLRAEIQATFFFVADAHGLEAAIDAVARAGAEAYLEVRSHVPPEVRVMANRVGVSVEILRRGDRASATERHLILWALRQLGYSYPAAARAVGLTNHTSAIHGVRRVERTPELLERARRMLAVVGHGEVTT